MFDGLGFLLLQEIFFCRVLDIRVTKIMKSNGGHVMLLKNSWYMRGYSDRLLHNEKF